MMDDWYLEHLVCPRDATHLSENGIGLTCSRGHSYPVVDGMPIMLLNDVTQTQWVAERSLKDAWAQADTDGLYLNSVGISDAERRGVLALRANNYFSVDPVVAFLVSATNGVMYKHVIGKLPRYPIPDFPLSGSGGSLLDIGCNWGRWSISAAKRGWDVVAIDPSLGAILAARRVARSMQLPIRYVVGDARYLPFEGATFDAAFSYGVLQHLSHQNAQAAVDEISRVLKPSGLSLVQMPNMFGLRSIYQQARRGFRPAIEFEVRYWPIKKLRKLFSTTVGSTRVSIDCFGGLGIQKADWDLMTFGRKLVIAGSESARFISRLMPFLLYVADSVYVRSIRSPSRRTLDQL